MTTDHKKLLAGTEVLKASPAEVALQSIHEILFPDGDPDHDSGSQELGEIINVVTAVIPAPEHHPLVLVGDFLNNIHTAFDHLQEVGWAEKNKSEVASIVGRGKDMVNEAQVQLTKGKTYNQEEVLEKCAYLRRLAQLLEEQKKEAVRVPGRLCEIADELERLVF